MHVMKTEDLIGMMGFLGFKFLHKKPDHLEFLLFYPENKKEIEIMKSFHTCSESRGLNRDDGIFGFQIFA